MPNAHRADPRQAHWQRVWSENPPETRSWFQPEPAPSLAMIADAGIAHEASIIDVGGGASLLVDRLLAEGFADVTVLDVAAAALARTQRRLGGAAARVTWITADVTTWAPDRHFALWHDRAVFHFLTNVADQARYVAALDASLASDGTAIIATFAPDGPEQCSNLPVQRHDAASLQKALGSGFTIIDTRREDHVTPDGRPQRFCWTRLRRR